MKKQKKNKLLKSLALLVAAVVFVGGLSFVRPVRADKIYIRISPFRDQTHFEANLLNQQILHDLNVFASRDYRDFVSVNISLEWQNLTPWTVLLEDGEILEDAAAFVVTKRRQEKLTTLYAYEHTLGTDGYSLICYRGSCSDSELEEKIRALTIRQPYETDLFSFFSMKLRLTDGIFVSDEEFYAQCERLKNQE